VLKMMTRLEHKLGTCWLVRIQLAAGTAVAALAVILAGVGWLTRRALDRRRLAGWDAEWLANGPRWSPRR
jgi:hypothetical protein